MKQKQRLRIVLLALLAGTLGLVVRPAQAVIVVTSGVSQGLGIGAQATITNPTQKDTISAVMIKEMSAAILVRDDNISNGIKLVKHNLTSAQAWGNGLPNGHAGPPPNNPEGPWNGLVWPYRDQYDYFQGPDDPLGNDVGTPFSSDPGVYGFVNVNGIARGGPTDPDGGGGGINLLDRGITGNGRTGPATYFDFDIIPLSGDPNRFVTIQIFAATARVVVLNQSTGLYSELQVPVQDFTMQIQLPEPATASALMLLAGSLLTSRWTSRRLHAR